MVKAFLKYTVLSALAIIVVVCAAGMAYLVSYNDKAEADTGLEERVSALETRVAALEELVATPLPPIVVSIASATPTQTLTPMPSMVPTSDPIPPTPTIEFAPTVARVRAEIYQNVIESSVRIRACPGTNCNVIGKLNPGDALVLCEATRTSKGGYDWMELHGAGGWIAIGYGKMIYLKEVNPAPGDLWCEG